ncbi:MAG: tRNA (guanine(9)-N(1))-methyltransferase [Thelocarpon impressellum]|nr:MAG: tRNA (guanine(9)-N(1))-methyltransferase [Thelocarpon impressellum]
MEAEERPRKLQKLDPTPESENASLIPAGAPTQSGIEPSRALTKDASSQPKDEDEESDDNEAGKIVAVPTLPTPPKGDEAPISKNQRKKLARKEAWEAGRASRKAKKKQKTAEKREQKRLLKKSGPGGGDAVDPIPGPDATDDVPPHLPAKKHHLRATQLPVTIVLDCGFDELMLDKERTSLASQLTRAYSDNKNAPFRAHLLISSFDGKLRERFETVLGSSHKSWRGVGFEHGDFVEAAERARANTSGPDAGSVAGALEDTTDEGVGELVYLTSDSPETLTVLRPHGVYVVGGLVDKNRHKGICYKRALDRGVRTAKLPLAEHMHLASRQVLATNHVVEIMLRWLECGNWGEAFMRVMPKRKGGVLKERGGGAPAEDEDAGETATEAKIAEAEETSRERRRGSAGGELPPESSNAVDTAP